MTTAGPRGRFHVGQLVHDTGDTAESGARGTRSYNPM